MNTKTMSNSINAPPTVTDFPLSLIFKLFSDPGMFQQIITVFFFYTATTAKVCIQEHSNGKCYSSIYLFIH